MYSMQYTKWPETFQRIYVFLYIVLTAFCAWTGCDDTLDFQKHIPVRIIWAAETRDVDLPCDISPPAPGDKAKLVLWFKDLTGIPLYSLDSRGGVLHTAAHSALASDLGQRIFFAVGDNPKDARLHIRNVKLDDGGVYRCRVDFFNSATRNLRVNLTLVVPPDEPRIFDDQGKEVHHIAGPFREGHEMFLSCQVTGGLPPPRVTWWRDGIEIASISQPSVDEGLSAIVNQFYVGTITRDYFGSKLECRAQGSQLIASVVKEISIQVHLKPLKIKIVSANDLLIAGKSVPLRCESWGSFPPAKMTWLLDGEPIHNADITQHTDVGTEDGNLTVSILNFKVSSINDGSELICRSSNPWFSGGAIEDKRIISVAYPPIVSVHLSNEDPSRVVTRSEQQNVTLKCRADARPPVTTYSWYKNGMRMSGENSEILHLTQLHRESGGSYSCGASNTEGETRSSTLTLKVQFAPRCKPGTEQTSVGSINLHSIPVRCEVEADPPESVRFSWTYNSTRNVSPINLFIKFLNAFLNNYHAFENTIIFCNWADNKKLEPIKVVAEVVNSRISSHGLISTMTYLPQSDAELITLACWASNTIGRQTSPCLVHILPAKIPDPPKACELRNDTIFEVICAPGSDGGLTQHFLLEVIGGNPIYGIDVTKGDGEMDNEVATMNDQATIAPIRRLKGTKPEFRINDLEAGREYQFLVYAVNAKGRSQPPIVMNGRSMGLVSDFLSPHGETILSEGPTPAETLSSSGGGGTIGGIFDDTNKHSTLIMLAAVIAAATVVVTSIIVIGLVIACRNRRPKPPEPQEVRKRMKPARTDVPSMYAEDDELSGDYTADIRCSRAAGPRSSRYISEGFVQYSQPSLNDPDLILPRAGDIEFTTAPSICDEQSIQKIHHHELHHHHHT